MGIEIISMTEIATNNKRILTNTIILYFRMFLVMAISLFTSRIILKNLDVEDFGIYNVVGSVVAMMAIVNSSMGVATQRYITFALGKRDFEQLKQVFNTSILIYALLSVLLICLSETIGLWWVNNKLVIPEERIEAANWVYQYTILSCCLTLFINPFNATIIAYEKMDYYAYLSIAEAILKLSVAYIIAIIPYDKLNTYGFLTLIVHFIVLGMYFVYCHRHFSECRFKYYRNNPLFKELLSYSGWNMFAAFSVVAKGQGLNMMLNAFFGPTVNAARGIAYQINGVTGQFFTNFYTAVKPQITKYYAQGKHDDMFKLIFMSARMSFFLILFISLPIMIESHEIIKIWLNKDMDYVVTFTRIIILISAIDAMATPLMTLMHAIGRIKLYQLVISIATILILPISYICLKYFNCNPTTAFIVSLCISIFCMFARLWLVNRYIDFPIKRYIISVYARCSLVAILSGIIPTIIYIQLPGSVQRLCLICVVSIISSATAIMTIGMNKNEREFVYKKIKKIIK